MTPLLVVINDNVGEQKIISEILRSDQYKIKFTSTGKEALEQIPLLLPNLIILDIHSPNINGFEVFRRIQKFPQLSVIPILIITTYEDRDAVEKYRELRLVSSISKPFSPLELRQIVDDLLGKIGETGDWAEPARQFTEAAQGEDLPFNDLPENRQVKQDVLLQGLAEAIGFLLTDTDFSTAVGKALKALGKAVAVDRVYIAENHQDLLAGELLMSQRYEWRRYERFPQIDPSSLHNTPFFPSFTRLYATLAAGKPYTELVKHVSAYEQEYFHSLGIQSFLIMPITVEKKLWGFIAFDDCHTERAWSAGELSIIQAAASGLGGVISRRRIEQVESDQRLLAEALSDTAKLINQSLNLNEVLEHILANIGRVVPHDSSNIMLIEDEYARFTNGRGYEGLSDQVFNQIRKISDIPNLKRMVDTGQSIVIPDTSRSPEWVSFKTSGWIHSYASAPICNQGNVIGFLNLNSAIPGFYSQREAERLRAFADQAAIAIVNARLFEKAQQELTERTRAEEALQRTMSALEERVEQRTIELRTINQQLELELTRRQQAEQALGQERTLLAKRVEERTAELSVANAELAKAARLKDAFLASMSHELRTPLNAILNISETLTEEVYGQLNDTQNRSIKLIENSGRHLLSLINDILDLSKIGAGKFELMLDYVPVKAVCQSSLQFIEEAARKKQIPLKVEIDSRISTVWADQRRLKQILVNLLNNAIKFTPEGGQVGLTVVANPEECAVRFSVWDTGIGITEDGIRNLFKPFVQLDNSLARQYEGTGLGLALVYNLVEMHGGGVQVESKIGAGSRFTISLPWEEAQPIGGVKPVVETGDYDNEVFTNPVIRVSRLLNEAGIPTQNGWIENGVLSYEKNLGVNLIVMDFRLYPQYCLALETAGIRRADELPVVLVAEKKAGVDRPTLPIHVGYLEFPFNAQELRKVIREIVPGGTAGLVHQAMMVLERKTADTESQPLILIVDDNETALRTLSDYLLSKAYRVAFAYNGIEAIERTREALPDLILMDIQMPGIDGLEAIRRIRADERIQTIPIIALTALAMQGDQERCLEAGANDYLSKPVSLKGLARRIGELIHRTKQPNR